MLRRSLFEKQSLFGSLIKIILPNAYDLALELFKNLYILLLALS